MKRHAPVDEHEESVEDTAPNGDGDWKSSREDRRKQKKQLRRCIQFLSSVQ